MTTCGQCGGIGEVQDMEVRQHGRYQMRWAPCRACDGTGRVAVDATSSDRWEVALDALVAGRLAEMEAEAAMASSFTVEGKVIHAPGFDADRLVAFVRTITVRDTGAIGAAHSWSRPT